MSYLSDNIDWGSFESTEDIMTNLQDRLAAQFLSRFVMLVMPSREHHPEQEKSSDEMIDEVQRLCLDFIQQEGSIDDAFDTELVQKFLAWNHHAKDLECRMKVADTLLKMNKLQDQDDDDESIH